MKKWFLGFIFLFLIFVTSCDTPKEVTGGTNNDLNYGDYIKNVDGTNVSSTKLNELNKKIKEEYDKVFISNYKKGLLDFFNIDNKVSIEIEISDSELKLLNKDYEKGNKETYRICDVNIVLNDIIYHYEEVGIRQKGNTSRGTIIDDNGNLNLRHYKLSFSETFDDDFTSTPKKWDDQKALEYRKNRSFFGLEKLNLRWNRNADSTYIREYFAFEMYREHGCLSPHSNPVLLEMNVDGDKQNLGVYLAVEEIDKGFIKRNVASSVYGGDLYKLGWTNVGAFFDSVESALFGVEKQVKNGNHYEQIMYPYDLKTNKKTSTHESIKGFISKIIENDNSKFYDFLKEDTYYEQFISYLAISYLLGDPDDLRGNYNNCYIYFSLDTNKVIFIPTDHDRVLGSTGGTGNPTNHHGAMNLPFDSRTGYSENNSPLFTKTIIGKGNDKIKNDYINRISDILGEKFFNYSYFQACYKKVKEHYIYDLNLGNRVNGNKIDFSLTEESSLDSGWNLSVGVYLETKKEAFLSYDPNVKLSEYYLRGQMNNWDGINDEYNLKIIDGIPTIKLYISNDVTFKPATADWSKELNYYALINPEGFECVGSHDNIRVLVSGEYLIQIIDYETDNPKLSITLIK